MALTTSFTSYVRGRPGDEITIDNPLRLNSAPCILLYISPRGNSFIIFPIFV
jgi:hypothetical protein